MQLRQAAREAIVAHALREAPRECCGLLIGSTTCIEEAVAARNARASPSRYQIDPADHFAAIRRVRHEGRVLIGAYHSHVSAPAVPSRTDVAEAYDEDLLHLIVSLQRAGDVEIRGYRIGNGTFEEVPLVTVL